MEKIIPITKEQALGIIFGDKFEVYQENPADEEIKLLTEDDIAEEECETVGDLLISYPHSGFGEVLATKKQIDTCRWRLNIEDGVNSDYDPCCLLELFEEFEDGHPSIVACRLYVVIKYTPTSLEQITPFIQQ